jgi:hypothetical protein
MMRHNALFALFPLLYLIASEFMLRGDRVVQWRPFLTGIVATVVLFFASSAIGDALATRHFKLNQQVAVFDLVAIAARTGEPIFEAVKYPELAAAFSGPYTDPAAVKKTYIPCDAFPIFVSNPRWGEAFWTLTPDESTVDAAWAAWGDAAKKHPRELIAHKLEVFICSLGIGPVGEWYAPIFWHVSPKSAELGVPQTGLSVLQKYVADQSWYLSKTPLYAVWIYFIVALIVAGLALFGRRRLDRLAFCIAVSGLMYQGGFLLIGIGTEFRYYTWLILCSVLSLALYVVPRIWGAQEYLTTSATSEPAVTSRP